MENKLTAVNDTADREIVLSRVFDAPRELVWTVWTSPVKPEKLVYNHTSGHPEDPGFHVTILFEQEDGKTKVTMRAVFVTKEMRDMVVEQSHAIEGGKQTLARMAAYLDKIS